MKTVIARTAVAFAIAATSLWIAVPAARAGLDPATLCHAKKLDAARGYGSCRLKVYTKAVKKGSALDFTKCGTAYTRKWSKIEFVGGSACPTTGDEQDVSDTLDDDTDILASLLEDGVLPQCGDGLLNGRETCDGAQLGGATCSSFGYTTGTLGCQPSCLRYDLTGCSGRQTFPATGQTTSYRADLNGAPDQVVDDDGAVRAGGVLSFVDNGDGTVLDLNTGLMWEKKGNNGGLHDVDNAYAWSNDSSLTIWDWIDLVNTEGGTGFAGHNDWRIPNRRELDSIVNLSRLDPAVSSAFNTVCNEGCSVTACSCTLIKDYWSSTTSAKNDNLAWAVDFSRGKDNDRLKSSNRAVRAVRQP